MRKFSFVLNWLSDFDEYFMGGYINPEWEDYAAVYLPRTQRKRIVHSMVVYDIVSIERTGWDENCRT